MNAEFKSPVFHVSWSPDLLWTDCDDSVMMGFIDSQMTTPKTMQVSMETSLADLAAWWLALFAKKTFLGPMSNV